MISLSHLTVNYLTEPVGITGPIELGWIMESDRRNVRQESYQLQIERSGACVYDSGVVESDESAHVTVCLAWASIARYQVRVRAAAGGETSDWLESFFVTGFQHQEEWRGRFVSAEPESEKDKSGGTLLRKEFRVEKPLREAWLVSSAHGLYHCFLNGVRAGQDEMAPGWTSYSKRLLYQTRDVTSLLRPGRNALGVMLGAGWYKGMMGYKHTRNLYGTRTAFGGQLILRYADGTEEWICSDESWRGSKSPVRFSEIYGGEIYDARLEQDGWSEPHFDDSGWAAAQTVERDIHTLFPRCGCPVRVQERFAPAALLTTPGGDTVLDFGQNMAGWCEITLDHTRAGDVAELEFFEVLDANGNVYTENLRGIHQTVRYICRGSEREICRPWFSFQGFQYAKIVAFPGTPKLDNFTACVVHSDMETTGGFTCSNPLLNQLQHNILWGMKGNFLDIPTDCPQRDERLAWTGDVLAFARTACYLMNADAFFRKWLDDVAADQTEEGAVPHVVPDILTGHMEGDWLLSQEIQGGASGWGDVAVVLPWNMYLTYGDREILRRQLPSMLAWSRFLEAHSEGCIFRCGAQFGDWLALDAEPGSYKGATPDEYVGAAWYCCTTALVGKILHILGQEAEALRFHDRAEALIQDFQRRFFTADGALTIQTQTAHVLALAFRLAPDNGKTVRRLKELLHENDGHLTTGFVGTPFLLRSLSENGGLEEAYELLLKEDFPSWLYQVKAGATTIWEHWDSRRPDGSMWSPDMNSFNHYAYGCVGEWLYRTVAGLELDEEEPGYRHFFIRPLIGGGLTRAEAVYQSVYGRIVSGWKREGDLVTLTAEIPVNTGAELRLEQAREILDADGLSFTRTEHGWTAHSGSGRYTVQYRI